MAKSKKPGQPDATEPADTKKEAAEIADTPIEIVEGPSEAAMPGPAADAPGEFRAEAEADVDVPGAKSPVLETDTTSEAPETQPEHTRVESAELSDETPAPLPVAAPVNTPAPGGFWPAVFGGIVAALIGFIVGRSDQIDAYLPSFLQRQAPDLTALETTTQALAQASEAQAARIETLETAVAGIGTDELKGAIATLDGSVSDLSARIGAIETRPAPAAPAGDGADAEALAALQASVAAQKEEIDKLIAAVASARSDAEKEAQRTLARAALTRVITAVDNGAPFEPALGDLEETGLVDVPEPLVDAAGAGVPTMAQLAERFPDAARAALAAARSEPDAGAGLTGFLKRQLGARSVAPREGSDADAILSRAEAAVKEGRLTDALAETDSLPDAAKTAMADWLGDARARVAAQNAAESLAQRLTTN